MKKVMIFLVAAVFCASLLTLSSCAKKQVTTTDAARVVSPSPAPSPAPGPAPAPAPAPAPGPAPAPAPAAPKPAAPAAPMSDQLQGEIRAFESTHIYFDYDKADIKAEAKAVLEKKAAWLRANSQFKVKIEGHCDERGTNEYNLALGDRRAKAAMKFLNALGISADKMTTISYGEEKPADPGHNESAWSKNRRAEFKLSR